MEPIASLYSKVDGKFACKACNTEMKRLDHIKRHIEGRHLKVKITCGECGDTMSKSAMSRHKRVSCRGQINQPTTVVVENHIVDSFQIQLIKSSDGSITVVHDPIRVNGNLYSLMPIKTSKINLNEDPTNTLLIGYALKRLIFVPIDRKWRPIAC